MRGIEKKCLQKWWLYSLNVTDRTNIAGFIIFMIISIALMIVVIKIKLPVWKLQESWEFPLRLITTGLTKRQICQSQNLQLCLDCLEQVQTIFSRGCPALHQIEGIREEVRGDGGK